MELFWEVRHVLWQARPVILAWVIPALMCYLGVSILIRALLAFRRARRGACHRCGYALSAARADQARCPECGATTISRAALRARSKLWLASVFGGAAILSIPLFATVSSRSELEIVAALLIFAAIGVTLFAETWRSRRRRRRWSIAVRCAVALVLQLPWMIILCRFAIVARLESISAQWSLAGIRAGPCFDAESSRFGDALLAWLPERWSRHLRCNAISLLIEPGTPWELLAEGPADEVALVWTGDPRIPTTPADAIRLLRRFPRVHEVWFSGVTGDTKSLDALCSLPASMRIGGVVRDVNGMSIGRIVDDGTTVRFEIFDATKAN